jgi:hypothetical protein
MSRAFAPIAALLALAALVAAGCGSSGDRAKRAQQRRPDPVAQSAAATKAAGSAKVAFRGSVGAVGRRIPLTGTGAVDFTRSRAKLTVGTRLPGAGALSVDQLIDGQNLYVRTPGLFALLAGGRPWLKIDLGRAAQAKGADLGALRQLSAGGDLSQYVAWLAVAGDARRTGRETVRGVPTTRYAARIDPRRLAAADPALRRSVQRLGLRGVVPLDVWLDDRGLVRRLHVVARTDATPVAATVDLNIDFFDFGTTVDGARPAAGETLDVTGSAASVLRLFAG